MLSWLGNYRQGMLAYDELNQPTVSNQWKAFADEFHEFAEALGQCNAVEAWSELNDCIHSFLRLVVVVISRIPLLGSLLLPVLILLPALGFKTARKHAQRFKTTGCIRSPAHCLKNPPDHACGRKKKGV